MTAIKEAPEIFIGSASEHAAVLTRLGALQTRTGAKYLPWTDTTVFGTGGYTLPSLCRVFEVADGAAFLSLSVDKTWWRGETHNSPRDNVIFEAGLAIGYLGVERTAIVTDIEAKLPTDLKGLNTIRFHTTGDIDKDVADLHERLDHFFSHVTTPRRVIRQMWDQPHYEVYFHSFTNPERGEPEEIVNFNAVRAIGFLSEALGRLGVDCLLRSSRLDELHVEDNLVLLGSSASNALSRRLNEAGSDQWRFQCTFNAETMGDRAVVDRVTGARYATKLDDKGIVTDRDYGILTKVRNPFHPRCWIIMAAGNYGFGTLGALRIATEPMDLASLPFGLHSEFQVAVEVPVTGRFSCGRPRIIASAPMP
jgi:hypothetical protein